MFKKIGFTLCFLLSTSYSFAQPVTENEKKATHMKIAATLSNELSHGNDRLFFLLKPDQVYYVDAETLFEIFEQNAYRGSEILHKHFYKTISGTIQSITPARNKGATISLKTSTKDAPYRQPINLLVSEEESEKVLKLNKGDYFSTTCLALWKYVPEVNSINLTSCGNIDDFLYRMAGSMTDDAQSFFEDKNFDMSYLKDSDIRNIYMMKLVLDSAKEHNDFKGLNDREIEGIISKITPDYEEYIQFKESIK